MYNTIRVITVEPLNPGHSDMRTHKCDNYFPVGNTLSMYNDKDTSLIRHFSVPRVSSSTILLCYR